MSKELVEFLFSLFMPLLVASAIILDGQYDKNSKLVKPALFSLIITLVASLVFRLKYEFIDAESLEKLVSVRIALYALYAYWAVFILPFIEIRFFIY